MFGWDDTWQCRIVCQWHALRNPRKAVYGTGKTYAHLKVEPEDATHDGDALRKEIMDLLMQMSKTDKKDDCVTAEKLLRQTLRGGSKRFLQHLETHYLNRRQQWCRSWRVVLDRHVSMVTSMHVESSFRVVKHVFLKGIANRRLDSLIVALRQYAAAQITPIPHPRVQACPRDALHLLHAPGGQGRGAGHLAHGHDDRPRERPCQQ